MSFGIIRAYRSIDNLFLLFQFPVTEQDGSMASVHVASEVAFGATAEAFCFTRPLTALPRCCYQQHSL